METFKEKFFPLITVALLLVLFMQQCSNSGKTRYLMDTVDKIETLQDSTFNEILIRPTFEEVELINQIDGVRTSKRVLYDQNAIVRTTIRPDDRMNEYDKEIEALEKELGK